jgi:hypothetical protein
LSGFTLTNEALPRTRLGKFRVAGTLCPSACWPRRTRSPSAGPGGLGTAARADGGRGLAIAASAFSGRQLDLDTDLALDLNLDSFGWMELSILLHERLGVARSEPISPGSGRSATC